MSRLEEKSKPILAELILNRPIQLNNEQLRMLASWVALMAMVAEYTDVPNMATPAEHREHLRQNGYPPDGWKVWLGNNATVEPNLNYHHIGLAIGRPGQARPDVVKCSIQFTTIVIGAATFYTASTTSHPNLLRVPHGLENNLVEIWPTAEENTRFPSPFPMSGETIDLLINPAWILSL